MDDGNATSCGNPPATSGCSAWTWNAKINCCFCSCAYIQFVKVTETTLASDGKAMAEVHRHGRPVAQIRRPVGIGAAELIERLKQVNFSPAEQAELKAAMDAATEVFAHADRH